MASALQNVGEHLAQRALGEAGAVADAFGRSAFNRYYYAAYLTTRELLGAVDPRWARQSHSEIPSLLENAFVRRIQGHAKDLAKSGAITEAERQQICRRAATASASMAATLRTAYALRVTSDYEPQTLVSFTGGTFRLETRTEGEARAWVSEIERAKASVTRILQELGLAT